jgi:hypothetical protein
MDNYLGFQGSLNPYKVTITNYVNSTKLGFIRRFRPKRFHKIDPSNEGEGLSVAGETFCGNLTGGSKVIDFASASQDLTLEFRKGPKMFRILCHCYDF